MEFRPTPTFRGGKKEVSKLSTTTAQHFGNVAMISWKGNLPFLLGKGEDVLLLGTSMKSHLISKTTSEHNRELLFQHNNPLV